MDFFVKELGCIFRTRIPDVTGCVASRHESWPMRVVPQQSRSTIAKRQNNRPFTHKGIDHAITGAIGIGSVCVKGVAIEVLVVPDLQKSLERCGRSRFGTDAVSSRAVRLAI